MTEAVTRNWIIEKRTFWDKSVIKFWPFRYVGTLVTVQNAVALTCSLCLRRPRRRLQSNIRRRA